MFPLGVGVGLQWLATFCDMIWPSFNFTRFQIEHIIIMISFRTFILSGGNKFSKVAPSGKVDHRIRHCFPMWFVLWKIKVKSSFTNLILYFKLNINLSTAQGTCKLAQETQVWHTVLFKEVLERKIRHAVFQCFRDFRCVFVQKFPNWFLTWSKTMNARNSDSQK